MLSLLPLWIEGEAAEDMSSTTLSLLPSTRSSLYLILPDRGLILKPRPPYWKPSWQLPSTEASACNRHFWHLQSRSAAEGGHSQSLAAAESDTNIPWQQLMVTLTFPGGCWRQLKVTLRIHGSSWKWHFKFTLCQQLRVIPHFLTAAEGDTHNHWQQLRLTLRLSARSWAADIHDSSSYRFVRIAIQRLT